MMRPSTISTDKSQAATIAEGSGAGAQQAVTSPQLLSALLFGVAGWYGPRFLLSFSTDSIISASAPFQTIAAGDVLLDPTLSEPLVEPPTVPSLTLIVLTTFIPALLMIFCSPSTTSRHRRLAALATTIGLSEAWTHTLKIYIRRRRPNFYALCEFDSARRQCTAPPWQQREAQLSFPSGHSSLSSAVATLIVLMAWQWLWHSSRSRRRANAAPLLPMVTLIVLPLTVTFFIAASRIVDHWHHPSDVVAGLGLGAVAGAICFYTWFPATGTASLQHLETGRGAMV